MLSKINLEKEIVCMTTIVDREKADRVHKIFKEEDVKFNVEFLAHGAAKDAVLDYLGLSQSEKYLVINLMSKDKALKVHKRLVEDFNIGKAGRGISFFSYISKFGGIKLSALYQSDENNKEAERDNAMSLDCDYEMIFAITTRGHSDDVMDAARKVVEVGGTVVNARGVGVKEAEKFLGITISPEKEIIFILTKKSDSKEVMKAIIHNAGPHSAAKTITFAMPVFDVVGLPDNLYYE